MIPLRAALCLMTLWAMVGLAQELPKKVSRSEALAAVTGRVQPPYPVIAKQFKLEGRVEFEALVSQRGTVEQVNIVSGNPLLTKPAAEALRKWRFRPLSANGTSVRVLAPITIAFKM